jgi:hypothetical protein
MAEKPDKPDKRNVMSQLASVGEDALGKITQNAVAHRAIESAMQLKDRVEKLVYGQAELEGRVTKLEQRVTKLERAGRTPPKRASTRSKPQTESPSPTPPAGGTDAGATGPAGTIPAGTTTVVD